MVAYNPPNQHHHPKSNGKVIAGVIIMILGIVVFGVGAYVGGLPPDVFIMFPFFFGGFIVIIIGVVTLMIGLKNRSIANGIAPKSRIMGRYMNWASKLSGNKNHVNYNQNQTAQYSQPYNATNSSIDSRKQRETTRRKKREIICSYCGTSNNIDSEFCIGCNSKLET